MSKTGSGPHLAEPPLKRMEGFVQMDLRWREPLVRVWEWVRLWTGSLVELADKHSGLGSWIGAVGAVLAIFATWAITDASYRRDQRQHAEQRRTEIDTFINIVDSYESMLTPYINALKSSLEPSVTGFGNKHSNDPAASAANDLAWIPATQWPSLTSFFLFKQYYFLSNKLLSASQDPRFPPEKQKAEDIEMHEKLYRELKDALVASRKLAARAWINPRASTAVSSQKRQNEQWLPLL